MKKLILGTLTATSMLFGGEIVRYIDEADRLNCLPLAVYDMKKSEVVKKYSQLEQNDKAMTYPIFNKGKEFGHTKLKYESSNKSGYMIYKGFGKPDKKGKKASIRVNLGSTDKNNGTFFMYLIIDEEVSLDYKCVAYKD